METVSNDAVVEGFDRSPVGESTRAVRRAGRTTMSTQIYNPFPETRIDPPQLEHGDVLFFRKPGFVQDYTDSVGDSWRHTALAANLGGYWWVLEAGLAGYRARPLTTALKVYDTCAVMRLSYCGEHCGRSAIDAAQRLMTEPTAYPKKRELVLAAMISYSRMNASRAAGWNGQMARRAGRGHIRNHPDFAARTICSRFVHRALKETCPEHRPVVDLTTSKTNADHLPTKGNTVLAEYFTMPDDIWRTRNRVDRFWLKP